MDVNEASAAIHRSSSPARVSSSGLIDPLDSRLANSILRPAQGGWIRDGVVLSIATAAGQHGLRREVAIDSAGGDDRAAGRVV
jgi:hypothetical protein